MGLDMYLGVRKSFASFGAKAEENKKTAAEVLASAGFRDSPAGYGFVSVETHVGYWRKANHIHNWFVVASEEDDNCQRLYFTFDQMKDLYDTCRKVLLAKDTPEAESVAEELLPTSEGFFFGATDYGAWYYEDIQDTVDMLNQCFDAFGEDEKDYDNITFVYQASW
jgi:hypothetical protein